MCLVLYVTLRNSSKITFFSLLSGVMICSKSIINDYMFYVRWFNKGLVYIDSLLDENNSVLSLSDVNEKFDIKVPFTTYVLC